MAAAFFNTFLPRRRATSFSAEARPALSTQPEIVRAMRDVGVDVRLGAPRQLSVELTQKSTVIVLMGCRDEDLVDEHATSEEWFVDDPAGKSLGEVRRIRDKVRRLVFALIEGLGWARSERGAAVAPGRRRVDRAIHELVPRGESVETVSMSRAPPAALSRIDRRDGAPTARGIHCW